MKRIIAVLLYIIVFNIITAQGYYGEKITSDKRIDRLDCRDMELLDVIRSMSMEHNLNIIAGDNVKGKVTVSFRDVDVDEALENILMVNNYTYIKQDNVIRVVPIQELKDIEEEKNKKTLQRDEVYKVYTLENADPLVVKEKLLTFLDSQDKVAVDEKGKKIFFYINKKESGFVEQIVKDLDSKVEEEIVLGLKTEIIKVKYLEPDKIERIITDLNINFDLLIKVSKELNSFIVHGKEKEVQTFKNIVRQFDIHPLQVVIEAKIIELSDSDGKQTGINWTYLGDAAKGNNFEITAGDKDVANGSYDGIDIKMGMLNLDNFELFFNALMEDNRSNLLSNPTITTISGKKAHINIGEKFRYRLNSSSSDDDDDDDEDEDIAEIETGITLEVTPVVYEDGKIMMELMQTVEEVTGYTADSLPQTSTRQTNTNVIIDDGNTLAIGGLIKEDTVKTKSYVPILGKIPLLGKLFTSETSTKKKTNLLIFITPHILKTREFSQDIILDENQKIYYNREEEDTVSEEYKKNINLTGKKKLIHMYLETGRNKEAEQEIREIMQSGIRDEELESYLKKATGGK